MVRAARPWPGGSTPALTPTATTDLLWRRADRKGGGGDAGPPFQRRESSLRGEQMIERTFDSPCAANGGKAWDHSALVRALEGLANHEIGQK